ncbi:MAG: DNA polymerase I [Betaproteobacteria bacterium]|nr:DNA polymerase I [Betaproteobacteria bacterium]
MALLLLVDGSSYLYRAFHALPELSTARGEPTGAMLGVLNMLRRLENDLKGRNVGYKAVVFDAKGKTFRNEWYPEYKANRPPMPESLVAQIGPLHECIAALGWPLLMESGVEADDVIGTLATRAAAAGIEVVISTGDKDLAQLVGPRVTLVNTMSNETLDKAGVQAKFGVPPERIVDYLALVGDTSDNVPGVAKVGPKTAQKWLSQYGSLDGVVAHASEIGGAAGENLRRALDFLPLGKKLVTIRCDLDIPFQPSELKPRPPGIERLQALFAHYEFRSLLREIQDLSGESETIESGGTGAEKRQEAPPASPRSFLPLAQPLPAAAHQDSSGLHRANYVTVLDWETFTAWQEKIAAAEWVAFDTETTSLNVFDARIVGISFATAPGEAAYIPLAHRGPGAPEQLDRKRALQALKPWFESPQHLKIGQHLKYEQHVLSNHGIALSGIAHDTMLESYVLESDRKHNLEQLASRHLGLTTISYEELCGKGAKQIGFDEVDVEKASAYGAEDADVTLRAHEVLQRALKDEPALNRLYAEVEMPVSEILFRMERAGVLVDSALLARQSHEIGTRLLALEQEAYRLAGQPFNLNSPKQLAEILFVRLKLPARKKTPGGTPSTDEEVLSELALDHPLPKLLLETRELAKLKNTYTDKLPRMIQPETGRVHTSFAQSVVGTGRLASSDPNLQNIPVRTAEGRKIRAAFAAPPGCRIISADYSQIELRIMAHLSGDERLLQAFAAGEDVHRATASEIFGIPPSEIGSSERRIAKVINFGLIYGMSAFGLARQLDLERGAAQAYIDRYFARYPGVLRYMEETRSQAHARGYVETLSGRRLWLPELRSAQAMRRQGAERAAINAPMQGTAADLVKLAMINVQNWLDAEKLETRLILQVHDELVLEAPERETEQVREALPRLMAEVARLSVPLLAEVGVGANWEEAH